MSLSSNRRTRIGLSLSARSPAPVRDGPQVLSRAGPPGHPPAPRRPPTCPYRTGPERPGEKAGRTRGIWPARRSEGHGGTGDHLAQARRRPGPRRPPWSGLGPRPPGPRHGAGRPSPARPAPATRVVYRHLLMNGMSPAEAASLTAFMCGLPGDRPTLVDQAAQSTALPAQPARSRPPRRDRLGVGLACELIAESLRLVAARLLLPPRRRSHRSGVVPPIRTQLHRVCLRPPATRSDRDRRRFGAQARTTIVSAPASVPSGGAWWRTR